MTITNFYSTKGGQGCSTVAAAYALLLDQRGETVHIEAGRPDDMAVLLGLAPGTFQVTPNITLGPILSTDLDLVDHMVRDAGQSRQGPVGGLGTRVLVVRNCYPALRAALECDVRPDKVVMIKEKDRALDERDVAAVLQMPVTVLHHDPAVARSVDSGLLAFRRLPSATSRALETLLPPAIERVPERAGMELGR